MFAIEGGQLRAVERGQPGVLRARARRQPVLKSKWPLLVHGLARGQRFGNCGTQRGVLRRDAAFEESNNLALFVHDVLAEVPCRQLPRTAQKRVNRRLIRTFPGHHLLKHGEGDVVGELAERGDLLGRARLLTAEIVARKAEHIEALALHFTLQLLETLVLRRVTALACDVHDKAYLALVLRQVGGLAVEGRGLEFVKRHGLLRGKWCYQGDRCKKRERERSGHEEILC